MAATKIMLIRHAEKPPKPTQDAPGSDASHKSQGPFGVTADGVEDKHSLIVQGWQRAGGLASFFSTANANLTALQLAVPQVIFASAATKTAAPSPDPGSNDDGSDSLRPIETVTPLAAKLGLTLDESWSLGGETKLVADAIAKDGVVLICWQHQAIPAIANILCQTPQPAPKHWPVPQKWPGDRFDVVWIFDPPSTQGGPWSFAQVPQNLLAGDEDSVISDKHKHHDGDAGG